MSLSKSYTTVIERNETWQGSFKTEPQEAAWASEAIFFVRALNIDETDINISARVQISPDGLFWCDEGTHFDLPAQEDQLVFCKVQHFGGWLRIVGEVPEKHQLTVIVYLTLKE